MHKYIKRSYYLPLNGEKLIKFFTIWNNWHS